MSIQILFEEPLYISAYDPLDLLQLTSMEPLPSFRISEYLPAQLANNITTQKFEKLTNSVDTSARTTLASNYVLNVLISGGLNCLWGAIHVMQIIAHFPLVNVLMPANCQVLFSMIIKVVTYDIIPVDGVIEWITDLYHTYPDKFEVSENFKRYEYTSLDPIKNLKICLRVVK